MNGAEYVTTARPTGSVGFATMKKAVPRARKGLQAIPEPLSFGTPGAILIRMRLRPRGGARRLRQPPTEHINT